MKKLIFPIASLFLITLISGCGMFGMNPSAPTKVEQAVFTTITNYHTEFRIETQTNTIPVVQIIQVTNETGVIVWQTNQFSTTNTVTLTNTVLVPGYTLTPSQTTTTTVGMGGSVINTFLPGVGSMISMGLLAVLGAWAQLRSSKRGATATALVQEIELVRQFIKTLPNGSNYDAAITKFLQDHQVEAGIITEIINMLTKEKAMEIPTATSTVVPGAVADMQKTVAAFSKP